MKKDIVNKLVPCPYCRGLNPISSKFCSKCGVILRTSGSDHCPTCKGTGRVVCSICSGTGFWENRSCVLCRGSGNVKCYTCLGRARLKDLEIEVHGANAKDVETVAKALLEKGMESQLLTGKSNIEVHLHNSVIGILNTGEIENVQSISVCVIALAESGNRDIAAALKSLTEAVASNSDITSAQRYELLEQLEELGKQLCRRKKERRRV